MYASDVEQSDGLHTDDRSNVTTDDEFYNVLVNAPPEFEDRLIPDECQNEIIGIEHLTKCLNRRFNAYPAVFMGTLKEALKEAFNQKEITERRPLLIYVNNDKSVYTNLFCKQLLCNEKTIEYLMDNYVLWAWDITFESNARKLNEMCKAIFPPWTPEKEFHTNMIEQYPLLIGIYRDINGDHSFQRLIEGSNKKPNINEFFADLIEFKEKFHTSEQQLEKAKEEAKQQMLLNLFQSRDIHRRSKHHHDRDFLRSISMLPHHSYEHNLNPRHVEFSRLVSEGVDMPKNPNAYLASNLLNKDELMRTFEQLHMDSDDDDDADDEDDDYRTPTVDHPAPKFP
jgi:hypothetical protein